MCNLTNSGKDMSGILSPSELVQALGPKHLDLGLNPRDVRDLVDHMGRAKASIRETIKAQIAQAATSAPVLAVAALAVVALVATQLRRNAHQEL